MTEKVFDFVFKFILIGNGSCGKTSLLHYYIQQKPKQNASQTIGVEFSSKSITYRQKSIKLQLWDTAGQERFRSITKTYYRGAIGAIIVFDITNAESFDALDQWIKDAREFSKPSIQIMVIGNKLDLADERVISEQQARAYCQENDLLYIETSSKNGNFVNEAFLRLVQKLQEMIETKVIDSESIKPKFLSAKQENDNRRNCAC